eukprot:701838-Rhodomonas_salina.1
MTQGVIEFASALFVDTAFTGCLCVRSEGRGFHEYAMENCYANAPRHLQPLMINWLRFGGRGGGDQEACTEMRALMQSNLKGAMDPAFESLRAAAAA